MRRTVLLKVGVLLMHISEGLFERTTVSGCPVRTRLVASARGIILEHRRVLWI